MLRYLTIAFFFFFSLSLHAVRFAGGEITYVKKDTAQYTVYVRVVVDCSAGAPTYIPLMINTPNTFFYDYDSVLISSRKIAYQPYSCNQNTCSINGYLYEEYIYKYEIDISSLWQYSSCDVYLSWTDSARVNSSTSGSVNQDFYLETYMNRCIPHSSISFPFTPQIVLEAQEDHILTLGGFDTSGFYDSISYSLTNAQRAYGTSMTYTGSYTYYRPITFFGFPNHQLITPAGFNISPHTGTLRVRPTAVQVGVIAIKANKYLRINGSMQLVSSVLRETVVRVVPDNTDDPPHLTNTVNWNIYQYCDSSDQLEVSFLDSSDTLRYRLYCPTLNLINLPGDSNNGHDTLHRLIRIDTPFVQNRVHYIYLAVTDSTCNNNRYSYLDMIFAVKTRGVPPPHRFPKITADIRCNSVQLSAEDTAGYAVQSYTWKLLSPLFPGTDPDSAVYVKTGDTVSFPLHDTGWIKFRVTASNDLCGSSYIDSVHAGSFAFSQKPSYSVSPDSICFPASVTLSTNDSSVVRLSTYPFLSDSLPVFSHTFISDGQPLALWITDSAGCIYSDTLQYKWSRKKPQLSSIPDDTLCAKNVLPRTYTISSSDSATVSYNWFNLDTTQSISFNTAADTQLIYRVTDTSGCFTEDTLRIEVDQFTISAGSDTVACPGGTITLNGSTNRPSWDTAYWPGGSGGMSYQHTFSQDEDLVFRIETPECIIEDTLRVTEYTGFSSAISGPAYVCYGGNTSLSYISSGGSPSYAQEWFMNRTALSTSGSLFLFGLQAHRTDTIVLRVTDSRQCKAWDTLLFTTWVPDVALSSNKDTICKGDTFKIAITEKTQTGPYQFQWTGYGIDRDSVFLVSGALAQNPVSLGITDSLGCQITLHDTLYTSSFNAEIRAVPFLCGSDSLEVFADLTDGMAPFTYSWTTASGTFTDSGFLYSVAPGTYDTVQLQVTDAKGCRDTASLPLANTSFRLDILGDSLYCSDEKRELIPLIQFGKPPYSFNWSLNGNTTTDSLYDVPLTEVRNRENTALLVLTDQNNCIVSDTIHFFYDPFVLHPFPDQKYCEDEDLRLNPSTTGFGSYEMEWTINGNIRHDSILLFNSSGPASVMIYLKVTDSAGCVQRDTFLTTESRIKAAVSGDTLTCGGDSIRLLASVRDNQGPMSILHGNGYTTSDTVFWAKTKAPAQLWYKVKVGDTIGCFVHDSIYLYFSRKTNFNFSFSDTAYCSNEPAVDLLTASSPSGGTWKGAGVSNNRFLPSSAIVGLNKLVYTAGDPGCVDSTFVIFYMQPAPQVSITFTPDTGFIPLNVSFTSLVSAANVPYQWSFGDLAFDTAQHPSHTYTVPGVYMPTLEIRDGICTVIGDNGFIVVKDTAPNSLGPIRPHGVFSVYPNPFTDGFTIRREGNTQTYMIRIYDATGRLVISTGRMDESEAVISMEQYSEGLYRVQILGPKGESLAYFTAVRR